LATTIVERAPAACVFASAVPVSTSATGHQRSSEVIRGHQRSSEVIRGNQRPSEVIRGPSEGHQKATEVLRSRQHTCLEERHESRYATRLSDGHSVAVKLGE
jgi:hypothetical protein